MFQKEGKKNLRAKTWKHDNSEVQKRRALKHRNTQKVSKSTNDKSEKPKQL